MRGGVLGLKGLASVLAGMIMVGPTWAAAAVPDCASNTELLGVSRIVEIDTSGAPRFGTQYDNASFLEVGEVVLTFDDGPLRHYTQRVLDALDAQCTRGTFFIVGRMAIADPDMLKDMARRGHTIGMHTWSHQKLSAISSANAKDEIELGLSATAKALDGAVAPFFRFPYLSHSKSTLAHLSDRKIATIGIDVDSRDFATGKAETVVRTVMSQLKASRKGIILFHDIQPSTAKAITTLLSELKAGGYRVVHMVPAAAAVTLPEYDAEAGEALAKKLVAAAKNPLAPRSPVWPSGTGKTKKKLKDAAESGPEILPWLQGTSATGAVEPAPSPAPAPKRRPQPVEPPDPWQLRTMGQ